MSNFICEKCNKKFNRKSHLEQHKNKKYSCENKSIILTDENLVPPITSENPPKNSGTGGTVENIIRNDNLNQENNDEIKSGNKFGYKLECEYCKKTFTRRDNLTRHLNGRCDEKNKQDLKENQINELIKINKLLLKQNDENKKHNDKLKNELEKVKKIQKTRVINIKTNKSISVKNSNNNMTNTNSKCVH